MDLEVAGSPLSADGPSSSIRRPTDGRIVLNPGALRIPDVPGIMVRAFIIAKDKLTADLVGLGPAASTSPGLTEDARKSMVRLQRRLYAVRKDVANQIATQRAARKAAHEEELRRTRERLTRLGFRANLVMLGVRLRRVATRAATNIANRRNSLPAELDGRDSSSSKKLLINQEEEEDKVETEYLSDELAKDQSKSFRSIPTSPSLKSKVSLPGSPPSKIDDDEDGQRTPPPQNTSTKPKPKVSFSPPPNVARSPFEPPTLDLGTSAAAVGVAAAAAAAASSSSSSSSSPSKPNAAGVRVTLPSPANSPAKVDRHRGGRKRALSDADIGLELAAHRQRAAQLVARGVGAALVRTGALRWDAFPLSTRGVLGRDRSVVRGGDEKETAEKLNIFRGGDEEETAEKLNIFRGGDEKETAKKSNIVFGGRESEQSLELGRTFLERGEIVGGQRLDRPRRPRRRSLTHVASDTASLERDVREERKMSEQLFHPRTTSLWDEAAVLNGVAGGLHRPWTEELNMGEGGVSNTGGSSSSVSARFDATSFVAAGRTVPSPSTDRPTAAPLSGSEVADKVDWLQVARLWADQKNRGVVPPFGTESTAAAGALVKALDLNFNGPPHTDARHLQRLREILSPLSTSSRSPAFPTRGVSFEKPGQSSGAVQDNHPQTTSSDASSPKKSTSSSPKKSTSSPNKSKSSEQRRTGSFLWGKLRRRVRMMASLGGVGTGTAMSRERKKVYLRAVPASLRQATVLPGRAVPQSVQGHIIVVGDTSHAHLVLRPLRARFLAVSRPVVLVNSVPPSDVAWARIAALSDVFFVRGSPLNPSVLRRAGIARAAHVIVLGRREGGQGGNSNGGVNGGGPGGMDDALDLSATVGAGGDQDLDHGDSGGLEGIASVAAGVAAGSGTIGGLDPLLVADAEALFAAQSCLRLQPLLSVTTELLSFGNSVFLRPDTRTFQNASAHGGGSVGALSPEFMGGGVFSPALLDVLLSAAFYNPAIVRLIEMLAGIRPAIRDQDPSPGPDIYGGGGGPTSAGGGITADSAMRRLRSRRASLRNNNNSSSGNLFSPKSRASNSLFSPKSRTSNNNNNLQSFRTSTNNNNNNNNNNNDSSPAISRSVSSTAARHRNGSISQTHGVTSSPARRQRRRSLVEILASHATAVHPHSSSTAGLLGGSLHHGGGGGISIIDNGGNNGFGGGGGGSTENHSVADPSEMPPSSAALYRQVSQAEGKEEIDLVRVLRASDTVTSTSITLARQNTFHQLNIEKKQKEEEEEDDDADAGIGGGVVTKVVDVGSGVAPASKGILKTPTDGASSAPKSILRSRRESAPAPLATEPTSKELHQRSQLGIPKRAAPRRRSTAVNVERRGPGNRKLRDKIEAYDEDDEMARRDMSRIGILLRSVKLSRVACIPIPRSAPMRYGPLVTLLLVEKGLAPLGLLRIKTQAVAPRGAEVAWEVPPPDEEKQDNTPALLRRLPRPPPAAAAYIVTNPPPDLRLRSTDRIYVLGPPLALEPYLVD